MRRVEATPEEIEAFTAALDRQLIDGRRTNEWLAGAIAEDLGLEPMTAEAIRNYRTGKREPPRSVVFAMERVFELDPGGLSHLLGYLPVEAVPALGVEEAIRRDGRLGKADRSVLTQLYRSRLDS